MMYKKLTNKKLIIISILFVVIIGVIIGFLLIRQKSHLANKPNPTPGSDKWAIEASKAEERREAEQKQRAKTQALNKILAEAPEDPKTRCEITYKFNAEQKRDEQIEAENKRHDAYIKKFGDNRPEQYTHKQNLERIQKQYDRSLNNMKCK